MKFMSPEENFDVADATKISQFVKTQRHKTITVHRKIIHKSLFFFPVFNTICNCKIAYKYFFCL